TGMSPFPPIGQLTYLLTLPPFSFYWFQLVAEADGPAWRTEPPEQMPDLTTLVLRRDLTELIDEERLSQALSRDILPAYLAKRRWFGSKGERLKSARLVAAQPMGTTHNILLGELEAELEGHTETYLLPLSTVWDDQQPSALAQQLAMARIRQGRRVGFLTDGFSVEALAHGVLRGLCERSLLSGRTGTLEFLGTDQLDCMAISDEMTVRWLSAEQSNSSLIVGDLAMIKLIRHIFPGIHPEVEMTRYLTKVGYANTAPLLGEVARVAPDGARYTLILVQGAIRNQGDAWNWMLTNLRRALDEIGLTQAEPEAVDDMMRPLVTMAGTIGTRLGELHAALATDTDEEAFRPLPARAENVELWRQSAVGQIERAFSILADQRAELETDTVRTVDALLSRRDELPGLAAELAQAAEGVMMIRNHGDFHLGQVLIAEADAYIIDFEGEPARDLSERRAKTIPLRDVAGLLRSLSYLAATAELENEAVTETESPDRTAMIRRFTQQAETAFLEGYLAAVEQSEALRVDPDRRRRMLDLYLLEKAAYEIAYEARNRPKWLPIPLAGFAAIVDRLTEKTA
ncbi:putative maltokinase, partial [Rhizobium straminoryzae]